MLIKKTSRNKSKTLPSLSSTPSASSTAADMSPAAADAAVSGYSARPYNPFRDLDDLNRAPSRPDLLLYGPAGSLYYIPTSPQLLFPEQALHRRRNWGENLVFCTGVSYLSGAAAGVARGAFSGLRAAESGESLKLRVNRVLNGSVKAGTRAGSALGILGMIYAVSETVAGGVVGDGGEVKSSLVAGAAAGAIYRSPWGMRSAAVAGAAGLVVSGLFVAGKNMVGRFVPIEENMGFHF